jgi:hypothetical protein
VRTLALCAALALAANAAAVERVLEFHSDIRIEASGELVVTERIAVQVERREIRRGILRDFPTDYRDRAGSLVRVPFNVLQVSRDGRPERYGVEQLSNGTRVRIGDANVLLSFGRHEYQIIYRTGRQIGFFADHDELYWNVNGNGWTFPFDAISARVTLPAQTPADRIKAEAYTGPFGARGRNYTARVEDGSASFAATHALGRGEGLTIVVSFPKGIVHQPTVRERLSWFLHDNRAAAAGGIGFLVLLAFLWWRWSLVGKDPREGPKFPRYEAPPGVGPAGARYVDKMGFDDRCIAALLLGLGQRGVIKIQKSAGAYGLERSAGTVTSWLPGEKPVLDHLLPGSNTRTTIGRTYDPNVLAARKAAEAAITMHFGEKLFSKNHGSLITGWVIAIAVILVMLHYVAPISHMVIVGVAMLVVLWLFKRWLPAYSVAGRRMEDAIVGLRQYLSVAEADDLKRLKAPPQTKEEFAKFLPYAVALDVEQTWADRFARTLGAAAVAAAVADYYSSSDSGGYFGGGGGQSFTSGLSSLGETISSAAVPPGSSSGSSDSGGSSSGSSDSGGSSGGGGGGGGGSGW